MYPQNFDYIRASSLSEAITLLSENKGAKLLAGGHSLIPMLKLRTSTASLLIDIGRIPELVGITRMNGSFRIGALTTHSMIAGRRELPALLPDAAGNIGDMQVRNRGTIGGNLSHADPASDLPTVMTALGATFRVRGPGGERSVAAGDFFLGLFKTALREDEILTDIVIPVQGSGTGSAYAKMENPASGYAMLGAAAVVTVVGGKCTAAGIALGGLTPKATRAKMVEAALVGKGLDQATIAAASKAVDDDLGDDLLGDIHASKEYRRAMAPVYLKRALTEAARRATM
jgi:carbon-monoxide dehydrogenase medium subunit